MLGRIFRVSDDTGISNLGLYYEVPNVGGLAYNIVRVFHENSGGVWPRIRSYTREFYRKVRRREDSNCQYSK